MNSITREEAIRMAKAKLECLERSSLAANSCNHDCDDCSLCYEQGNVGEQKAWLEIAIDDMEIVQTL